MKTRFSSIDIVAIINELNKTVVSMRINQIYDIDNKTYLFKLTRQDEKVTLLVESGIRIHTTGYEWPKNPAPSGFTMKLRKHLKNKRLEKVTQLGIDRIVDMQFGINEAAYHVIVELYDRGNIVLTDCEYIILNLLRPRTTGNEDVAFVVRERYPIQHARPPMPPLTEERLQEIFATAKEGDTLRKILGVHFMYGPAILDHVLRGAGITSNSKIGKDFDLSSMTLCIFEALKEADILMEKAKTLECKGYLIQKKESSKGGIDQKEIVTNLEFHPFLFHQHEKSPYTEYPSFDKAVDYFFSNLESQKIDLKALHKEKEAMKKLENIKKDQKQRIDILQKSQIGDTQKAQLIEMNLELVEKALLIIQTAIANQISWNDIWDLIQEAKASGNPVAKAIKKLKFETNHFTMLLCDPYMSNESDESNSDSFIKQQLVDIDLDLSAYANARKYYDLKRYSSKKEQKTMESSGKVYKIAEKKTRETLKEVALTSTITKARKVFWFEKFLWFISSENYIIIAGRDIQQNEMLVKRYMKPGDIYVHADLHGASSIIIKNPSNEPVPPKTLNEAGTMAVCYSAAWEARVVTSAWWVYHHQVSKTAPSGEYLTAGSFMIRGKKNYLPPSHLIMGFGFMFKLDEDSIERHADERKVRKEDDESVSSEPLEADEDIVENLEGDSSDSETETGQDEIDGHLPGSNNECEESKVINLSPIKLDTSLCDQALFSAHEDNTNKYVNEEAFEFPDTKVKLPHIGQMPEEAVVDELEEEHVVYLGDDKPVVVKPATVKCKESTRKNQCKEMNQEESESLQDMQKVKQMKRGQKSKLKKIKEKYRDQDEEERNLRMKILASAGTTKEEKGKKGKDIYERGGGKNAKHSKKQPKKKAPQETPVILHDSGDNPLYSTSFPDDNQYSTVNVDEEKEETLDETSQISEELKILNSLTGCPSPEDTLLFSVPVCAPYATMTNYKYKVKVMPGNGRRGKGAKTAVHIFLHDKTATQREKDLLRSVKDQDISRNLPGKLKLAAPNLSKLKYGR